MNYDVLVVGCSLAGIAFCDLLDKNGLTYKVFDDDSQHSSKVAAGLYNPIILKRFSKVWEVQAQLDIALPYYKQLESVLDTVFNYEIPIHRLFHSIEEQNLWFEAADNPALAPFLSLNLKSNNNEAIEAPYGFGEVKACGRVDTKQVIQSFRAKCIANNTFVNARFDHEALQIHKSGVSYNAIQAKRVVFCEGYGLINNPYFNHLPLQGTKGEVLTIHAPDLKLNKIVKSAVFVIPLGDDLYSVGATYAWDDKTSLPTQAGCDELESKLKRFLKCDYKIVDHVAGIRPTVKDRRPLVGQHPKYESLYVLNGLGTRGVLIGPYAALHLFNSIYKAIPISTEISVERFTHLYQDL